MGGIERLVRLKVLLFERHITQNELAKKVGMTNSQISLFITGRMIPWDHEKKAIADALQTSVADLFNR